ncbi:MAG TPA: hypothetical protein VGL94_15470 [Ktedonobacteraceae bacterium]|jgi:hypothetical protein
MSNPEKQSHPVRDLDPEQKNKIYEIKHKIKEAEASLEKLTQPVKNDPYYLIRQLIDKEKFDRDIKKVGEIRREASACIRASVIDRNLTEFLWELNQAYNVLNKYMEQISREASTINIKIRKGFDCQESRLQSIYKNKEKYGNKLSDECKQEFNDTLILAEKVLIAYPRQLGDKQKEHYIQLCKANDKLLDIIGEQETVARRERIEKLLKNLPEPESRPTLRDLPRDLRWLLFIDVSEHEKAKKIADPGNFFDQNEDLHHGQPKESGYQQSMMGLFDNELVTAQSIQQKHMGDTVQTGQQNDMYYYDEYTRFHNRATEHLTNNRKKMRQENGLVREGEKVDFAYYSLWQIPKDDPQLVLKLQERRLAFKELYEQRINGLPLLQEMPGGKNPPLKINWLGGCTLSRPEDVPQGIMGYIMQSKEEGYIAMIPLYSPEEGKEYVNTILKSYKEGRKVPDQTEYQRLREIAKTIHTLNLIHQKFDANGRTNVNGYLYKFLQEEGFSPAILPNGTKDWCGEKMLDGFVEEILLGMHEFIKQVKQSKQNIGNSLNDSGPLEITPAQA